MRYCLWCDEEIIKQINWQNFISRKEQGALCHRCSIELKKIQSKRCLKCSRSSNRSVCYDCERWEQFYEYKDPLNWNYSIFHYNNFMKEIITQWKYRGDYILANAFKFALLEHFKQITTKIEKPFLIQSIPLSNERLLERGFNQADAISQMLTNDSPNLLIRLNSEKQSKRSRKERILSKNSFKTNMTVYKSVILVDDIYTTGSTLRQAATVLKSSGCPNVYSYTLIRG